MAKVTVRVKPNSAHTRVGGSYPLPDAATPALVVAVSAPAVDGRANDAVVKALARSLGVKPRQIELVAGHKGRTKVFEIPVQALPQLHRLLAGEPPGET